MKSTIVVPLAGKGQRFVDAGYTIPKPLIMAKDKTIIEWAMDGIDTSKSDLIFVVRAEHVANFSIDSILISKFPDAKIVVIDKETGGSVETVLYAEEYIDPNSKLLIWCSDVYFKIFEDGERIKFRIDRDFDEDGGLLTFRSNSPNYSYCLTERIDGVDVVKTTREKLVISDKANLGAYYFKNAKLFFDAAKKMVMRNDRTNGEFFIAPVYNYLINDGKKIVAKEVEIVHIIGTPKELDFFKNCIGNLFSSKPIALACDHSGFETKERFKTMLLNCSFKVVDHGCYSTKPTDYVTWSTPLIQSIKEKNSHYGFLFCKTGAGQNIYANRFAHIRSVLVTSPETMRLAIEHNAANVFAIPELEFKQKNDRVILDIIEAMLESEFMGGRHQARVQKIMEVGGL